MKKLITIFVLFFASQGFCESAAERLQVQLNTIKGLTATFTQVVHAKNKELSNAKGTMALQRPGRFRWDTRSPLQQLVVADGTNLWIYDPDLEQVTVKKQDKELNGTAALFLSHADANLMRDFDVTAEDKNNNHIYHLKAKSSKATFPMVTLTFTDNLLTELEMLDQLGQHTTIKFSKIKPSPTLNPTLFQFKPPKGTDVIKQ